MMLWHGLCLVRPLKKGKEPMLKKTTLSFKVKTLVLLTAAIAIFPACNREKVLLKAVLLRHQVYEIESLINTASRDNSDRAWLQACPRIMELADAGKSEFNREKYSGDQNVDDRARLAYGVEKLDRRAHLLCGDVEGKNQYIKNLLTYLSLREARRNGLRSASPCDDSCSQEEKSVDQGATVEAVEVRTLVDWREIEFDESFSRFELRYVLANDLLRGLNDEIRAPGERLLKKLMGSK